LTGDAHKDEQDETMEGDAMRQVGKNRKARLLGFIGGRKAMAAGLMLSAVVFTGRLMAHNATMVSTISPVSGSVITETEVEVSGTFSNSGCGLTTNITADVSDGTMSALSMLCVDGVWSWSGTWSGYGAGPQTVTVDFSATHGSAGSPFVHSGSASATYIMQMICEEPDAPAIANAYLRELGVTNRDHINTIIPQVAHAMNAGQFGENPCAPGYADAVRAFVQTLYDQLVD
jgi:hypothetical protein